MKRKKQRKQKRFMALLLAMLLVLNLFLPASSISSIAGNEISKTLNANQNEDSLDEAPDGETPDGENPDDPDVETPGGEDPDDPDGENTDSENQEDPDDENSDGENPDDPDGENSDGENQDNPDGENSDGENPDDPDGKNSDGENLEEPIEKKAFALPPEIGLFSGEDSGRNLTGDTTGLVSNITLTVKNGEGGQAVDNIYPGKSFYIEGSFNVYSKGNNDDDEESGTAKGDWIKNGDYVLWELDENISGTNVEINKTINGTSEKIADVEFGYKEDGITYAKIIFTGIYDDITVKGGNVTFGATLTYTNTSDEIEEEGETIVILGKDITIKPIPITPRVNVKKTGEQRGDIVNWTVEVDVQNTSDDNKPLSLNGYTFTDTLKDSTSGKYVGDTFKLNGTPITGYESNATEDTTLTYTFNEGVTAKQIFTFSTKVPENQMLGGEVNNTALFSDEKYSGNDSETVTIATITVITKEGESSYSSGSYNPASETITWTITVIPGDIPMKNVQVEDVINGSKLEWVSAEWKWVDDSKKDDGIGPLTVASAPTDGIYKLNNTVPLTNNINLIIKTKVKHGSSVSKDDTVNNTATLYWSDYLIGKSVTSDDVGVGIDVLDKAAGTIDYKNRQIPWTITFNAKGQLSYPVDDSKIYDLFLYEKSGSTTGFTAENDTYQAALNALLPNANRSQRIVPDSNNPQDVPGDLSSIIVPVMSGTRRVGDLLVISGLKTDDTDQIVSFKTEVLDPDIFAAKVTSSNVENTARLYNGTTELDTGKATAKYEAKVLTKSTVSNFDYSTNTAVFKLWVNPKSINLNHAVIGVDDNNLDIKLGNIMVTDKLPAGWGFYNFDESDFPFEIYNADASGNKTGSKLNLDEKIVTHAFTEDGESGRKLITFTFAQLDQPYVILVKAKITDEQYKKLLTQAYTDPTNPLSSQTETNNSEMTASNSSTWKPTDSSNVTVNTKVLSKSTPEFMNNSSDQWTGVLKWTVEYNPYNFQFLKDETQNGKIKIVDTLEEGHSMIYSNITGLNYSTCTVWAYANPEGTFPSLNDTHKVSEDDVKNMISYNPDTRTMTFIPKESGYAYKLEYQTYATDDTILAFKNHVALMIDNASQAGTKTSGSVSNQWADADVSFTGRIKITKVDGTPGKTEAPLAGVKFELYDAEKAHVIKTSQATDSSGVTYIRAIPAPMSDSEGAYAYWLKEIVPTNYLDEETWYPVSVEMVKTSGNIFRPQTTVNGASNGEIKVVNKLLANVGSLEIEKVVNGNRLEDEQKEFEFTVKVTGAGTGSYSSNQGPIAFADDEASVTLTGSSFIKITGLPTNSYEVVETSIENCDTTYVNNLEVSSKEKGSGTIVTGADNKVTVTNTKYELSILKQDGLGDTLSGASLELQKDGDIYRRWTSANTHETFYNLPDGNYTLVETEAPPEYVLAKNIDFIVENGQPKLGETNIRYLTMTDHKKGQIIISKKAVSGTDELPGAVLELNRIEAEGSILVEKWTSKKTPKVFPYLPDGDYELTELEAPPGYHIASQKSFTIIGGEADQQITMYDAPVEILILKTDFNTGDPLPKAKLRLLKGGVVRETWTSGSKAHTVYRLEDGIYELEEIEAPYGYLIADKITFEVKGGKTAEPVIIMKDIPVPSSSGGGGGGGGPRPTTPTTPPTTPPGPIEPVPPTPQVPINPGETPRGRVQGPDGNYYEPQEYYDIFGQVPLGYMVGPNGMLIPLGGLPKTGDGVPRTVTIFGLLSMSAFLGIAASARYLRKKRTEE